MTITMTLNDGTASKGRRAYSAQELLALRGSRSQPNLAVAIEELAGGDVEIVKGKRNVSTLLCCPLFVCLDWLFRKPSCGLRLANSFCTILARRQTTLLHLYRASDATKLSYPLSTTSYICSAAFEYSSYIPSSLHSLDHIIDQ